MENHFLICLLLSLTCTSQASTEDLNVETASLDTSVEENDFDESELSPGDKIDEFNGVSIFYNGGMNNVSGRNMTKDGYNIGLRYQCVEFVKRYYLKALGHKMPNTWGHAKDFYNPRINDGKMNSERGLIQFKNGSLSKPKVSDILVFDKTAWNPFGHIAIVSRVGKTTIEIAQQNVGGRASSRETIRLTKNKNGWRIVNRNARGWLRKR